MNKPKFKSKAKAGVKGAADAVSDKPKSLMESAQQIWLAGMGAFSRAQGEGKGLFETLLKEGASFEQKTRSFATDKVEEVRDAVENTVGQVKERAADTWDRLENVFESRVSKALSKLGVPGRDEMEALVARVEELNRTLKKAGGKPEASFERAAKTVKTELKAANKMVKGEIKSAKKTFNKVSKAATKEVAAVKKTVRSVAKKAAKAIKI